MNKLTRYSPEVRERAVQMVFEHQGECGSQCAAIGSIAAKIGCNAETLRMWVRRAERDRGLRTGPTTSDRSALIHHSDRGSQYVSIRYSERLAEAGIESSVGSVGDFYDNALAETINSLYKTEVIHCRSWRNREAVELATLEWVDWFNRRRLLTSIGNVPPMELEAQYYANLTESAMAA